MIGHTAEPLYPLIFPACAEASQFIDVIRTAISSEAVHRRTPPGPLVIYGIDTFHDDGPRTLFVTVGILRVAEMIGLPLPQRGTKLDGAGSLPNGAVALVAAIGGRGDLRGDAWP
jgi:hypothetical protein